MCGCLPALRAAPGSAAMTSRRASLPTLETPEGRMILQVDITVVEEHIELGCSKLSTQTDASEFISHENYSLGEPLRQNILDHPNETKVLNGEVDLDHSHPKPSAHHLIGHCRFPVLHSSSPYTRAIPACVPLFECKESSSPPFNSIELSVSTSLDSADDNVFAYCMNIGKVLSKICKDTEERSAYDIAALLFWLVANGEPTDQEVRAAALLYLGSLLQSRYSKFEQDDDLHNCLPLGLSAMQISSNNAKFHDRCLSHLAGWLKRAWETIQENDPRVALLEDYNRHCRQAVSGSTESSTLAQIADIHFLSNLNGSEEPEDARWAAAFAWQALQRTNQSDASWPSLFSSLKWCLALWLWEDKTALTGTTTLGEDGDPLTVCRQVVSLWDDKTSPSGNIFLVRFGASLLNMGAEFLAVGRRGNASWEEQCEGELYVIESIEVMRHALPLSLEHPHREHLLSALWAAYGIIVGKNSETLAKDYMDHLLLDMIPIFREFLLLVPQDVPRRAEFVESFALLLKQYPMLFTHLEPKELLDICAEYHQNCRSTLSGVPLSSALVTLGAIALHRFKFGPQDTKDAKIAEDAYNYATEAIQLLDSSSEPPTDYTNGLRFHCHYTFMALSVDPSSPYHSDTEGIKRHVDSITNVLNGAYDETYGGRELNTQDLTSSGPNFTRSVMWFYRHFDGANSLARDIKLRFSLLSGEVVAGSIAAVDLCEAGRPQEAVEIVEESRSLFWSRTLQLRTPFDKLPAQFREPLESLSRDLEELSFAAKKPNLQSTDAMKAATRMRYKSDEFEELMERVREEVPGQERFLLPPAYEHLRKAARNGPVVILVSDTTGVIALCLTATDGDVEVCTFPEDLNDTMEALAISFSRAAGGFTRDAGATSAESQSEEPLEDADDAPLKEDASVDRAGRVRGRKPLLLLDILKTLWYRIVKPIFDKLALKPRTGRDRPRLWWYPTGVFTHLPIHAAGDYATAGGQCCSDYVVPSYTPTLETLITARDSPFSTSRENAKMLLAAVPKPFQGERLYGVVTELKRIRQVVPSANIISLDPVEDAALGADGGVSAQTVMSRLPEATIFHLACHGKQDERDPFRSGLILRDMLLPVSDLMRLKLRDAFLGFLSACETAKTDGKPDFGPLASRHDGQFVNLAATMLFVGFRSVIGTMWRMNDDDGTDVAETVYRQLFAGDSVTLDWNAIPYALDEIMRSMRERGLPPERWAPFIHLGI